MGHPLFSLFLPNRVSSKSPVANAFIDEVVHYSVDVEFLESAARVAIQPPLVSSKIRLSMAISLPPVSHTFEDLLQGAECEHR